VFDEIEAKSSVNVLAMEIYLPFTTDSKCDYTTEVLVTTGSSNLLLTNKRTYTLQAYPIRLRYAKANAPICDTAARKFNILGTEVCVVSDGILPTYSPGSVMAAPSLYTNFKISLVRKGLTDACKKKADEAILKAKNVPVHMTIGVIPSKHIVLESGARPDAADSTKNKVTK